MGPTVRDPEEVEYGIDTRPEALGTSYHGGMADVSYFQSQNSSNQDKDARAPTETSGKSPLHRYLGRRCRDDADDFVDKSIDQQYISLGPGLNPSPGHPTEADVSAAPSPKAALPGRGHGGLRLVQPSSESRYGIGDIHESPIAISQSHQQEPPPPSYDSALNAKV